MSMARHAIAFACGIAAGWWIYGLLSPVPLPPAPSILPHTPAPRPVLTGISLPEESASGVTVPKARMMALVDDGRPTALKLGQFIGKQDDSHFQNLCGWLELGAEDRDKLLAILKQAVLDRMAWEKENVVVDNPATGRWILHFPSDQGAARDGLRKKLEEAFGKEVGAAIDLGGNLRSFFNIGPDNFRRTHGEVRIAVNFNADPHQPRERRLTMLFHDDESSRSSLVERDKIAEHPNAPRLFPLLGTEEQILEEAKEAGPIERPVLRR